MPSDEYWSSSSKMVISTLMSAFRGLFFNGVLYTDTAGAVFGTYQFPPPSLTGELIVPCELEPLL